MCEGNRWDRMKASRNGPSFSYVFFADDLMLFAKANHKNCEAIIEVLDNFCNFAGQKLTSGSLRFFFLLMFLEGRRGIFVERWA